MAGQASEIQVLTTIVEKGWRPSAVMLSGQYGCGKTTLARILSASMLCEDREGVEPCGRCPSCKTMPESNPSYSEIDSASNGLVADVRDMKEEASYRVVGGKARIIVYDESHNISVNGQNALLQILEEGREGLMFVMCTTDPEKMLPTIRSRCVELNLKLLTADEVFQKLRWVGEQEHMDVEEKALRVIATYTRGHVRDAMVLLEQVFRMGGGKVTEVAVRTHLRLDKLVEVYTLLTTMDPKLGLPMLESLLCSYSPGELVDNTAQILLDSYKLSLGIGEFGQVDQAWMQRVLIAQGPSTLLEKAEQLLSLNTDFSGITYGMAAMGRVLFGAFKEEAQVRSLTPGSNLAPNVTSIPMAFRKPSKA